MHNLNTQMNKMDLMKPITLVLDSKIGVDTGQSDQSDSDKPRKITTTLCYDLMKDHEESMILNRSVNHPKALMHQGTVSLLHIHESMEQDDKNGDLVVYTKQDGDLHPWSKNIISDTLKDISKFGTKCKVVKFVTYNHREEDSAMIAVLVESLEQKGEIELFFSTRLEIHDNSQEIKWLKCNLDSNISLESDFHISLARNLRSNNGDMILLLAGKSTNNFTEGYVTCLNRETGVSRKWKQLPSRGEKEILEVKRAYRQFDQGFYFLSKDDEECKGKIIYYDIDKWLKNNGSITSNSFNHLNKYNISAIDSLDIIDEDKDHDFPVSHIFYSISENNGYEGKSTNAVYHSSPENQNSGFMDPDMMHSDAHSGKIVNLVAVEDHEMVFSVYSVDENSELHRTTNKNHNPFDDNITSKQWVTTKIYNNVFDIAALGHQTSGGLEAEIFLVTGQDKNSIESSNITFERLYKTASAWQHEQIMSEHENKELRHKLVSDTTMNVVKISFKDQQHNPIMLKKPKNKNDPARLFNVKIRTSEAINFKIHNAHYHLKSDQSVTVPVSAQGTLDIGILSKKLISPILTVNAEFLENSFSFDPIKDSYDRINNMEDASHYKNPKNRFGETKSSLVPHVTDEVLDSSIQAIKQLHEASRKSKEKYFCKNLQQFFHDASKEDYVNFQDAAKHSVWVHDDDGHVGINNLKIDENTEFSEIGFKIHEKKNISMMKTYNNAALQKALSSPSSYDNNTIWTTVADIFHRIEHAIEDVVSIILKQVGNAIHIVLEVAGKIFVALLKTIEDVFSTIFNIFTSVLKIAEEILIDILSMILPWEDIKKVYGVLDKKLCKKYFKDIPSKLDKAGKEINSFFGTLEKQFKKAQKAAKKLPHGGKLDVKHIKSNLHKMVQDKEKEESWLGISDNPIFHSMSSKMTSVVSSSSSISQSLVDESIHLQEKEGFIKHIEDFINNQLCHFLHAEKVQIKHFIDTIKARCSEMTNAIDILSIVFEAGLITFLESTKNLTNLFFDLMKMISHEIYNVLFDTEHYLPFFTSIFKSDKCLASKDVASLLSVLIMIISVPVTLIIKLTKIDILSDLEGSSVSSNWNYNKFMSFVTSLAGTCSIAFASLGAVSSMAGNYFDAGMLWNKINAGLSIVSMIFYVAYIVFALLGGGDTRWALIADALLLMFLAIQLLANFAYISTLTEISKGMMDDFLQFALNMKKFEASIAQVLVVISDALVLVSNFIVLIVSLIPLILIYTGQNGNSEKAFDEALAWIVCGLVASFTVGEVMKFCNTVTMIVDEDPNSRTFLFVLFMLGGGIAYTCSSIAGIANTVVTSIKPFKA